MDTTSLLAERDRALALRDGAVKIAVEAETKLEEALARIRDLEAKIMETRSYYVDRVEDLEHEVTTVRKGLQAENEALKKHLRQQKLYADTAVEVDAMRLRQIEKANTEIAFLRQMLDGMAKRVAEQSELLSKRAELEPSDNNDMRIDEL